MVQTKLTFFKEQIKAMEKSEEAELADLKADVQAIGLTELCAKHPRFEKYFQDRLAQKKLLEVEEIKQYDAAHMKGMCMRINWNR